VRKYFRAFIIATPATTDEAPARGNGLLDSRKLGFVVPLWKHRLWKQNVARRSKKRFPEGSVCKPCWELKYCPYGSLVEMFPLTGSDPIDQHHVKERYDLALSELTSGKPSTEEEVWDAVQRLLYLRPETWLQVKEYDPKDVSCLVWGHVCPVFFTQSGATETIETRSESRTIPREIMLKVVRRDAQHCRICLKWVPDNEIEFDHIIPHSRGGPSTVENIRLLCRPCNRTKGNSVKEFLEPTLPEPD
jgi:5-methylcytosine-specific restriction endonuclease McrA